MFLESVEPGSPEACHIVESEKDQGMRARCIRTYVYQVVLLGTFCIVNLIDILVIHNMTSISQATVDFFSYLAITTAILLSLLLIFGFIFAARGVARALGFALMITAIVITLLFNLGLDYSKPLSKILDVLFYSLLPLAALSLCNLLWALFVAGSSLNIIITAIIVVLGAISVFFIEFFVDNTDLNTGGRVCLSIFYAFIFLLFFASWTSASRYSLRLK